MKWTLNPDPYKPKGPAPVHTGRPRACRPSESEFERSSEQLWPTRLPGMDCSRNLQGNGGMGSWMVEKADLTVRLFDGSGSESHREGAICPRGFCLGRDKKGAEEAGRKVSGGNDPSILPSPACWNSGRLASSVFFVHKKYGLRVNQDDLSSVESM
jgi:hypothetical protein